MPTTNKSIYRFTGRTAIASGTTGIIAYGFLVAYLAIRNLNYQSGIFFLRFHDAGVIFQFLLFIPVACALFKLPQQSSRGITRTALIAGIAALAFTVLFLLLGFLKIIADTMYMFPQGVFGLWLITANLRTKGLLSEPLRCFGAIVGVGLALVGTFPLGYALFVDPVILQIPAAADEAISKVPADTTANIILHQIVWIGSFMGVLTFPIWTILLGRRLLRENIDRRQRKVEAWVMQ